MNMLGVITGVSVLVGLGEILRELSTFRIRTYEIKTERLKGLKGQKKIVFLSDLHGHVYGESNKQLVEAISREHPDYILVGGDMLVGKVGQGYEKAVDFMKQLPSICPVYYANGNHEQRMKEKPHIYGTIYKEYVQQLRASGIHMLENASVKLMFEEAKVQISGIEIPLQCYEHVSRKTVTTEDIRRRIGEAKKDCFQILLAHNPVYVESYKKWGADVILSGHLHGGIVRIPGVGGVITPQIALFPKYSGEMREEQGVHTIVSRGLGTHTVNVRFCNMAEVVSIIFSAK